MDMKELFENGCFIPEWSDAEEVKQVQLAHHKNLDELLDELAEIKENIENLQAKSWYLERLRHFHEHGMTQS